jgi:hypothetical protein
MIMMMLYHKNANKQRLPSEQLAWIAPKRICVVVPSVIGVRAVATCSYFRLLHGAAAGRPSPGSKANTIITPQPIPIILLLRLREM